MDDQPINQTPTIEPIAAPAPTVSPDQNINNKISFRKLLVTSAILLVVLIALLLLISFSRVNVSRTQTLEAPAATPTPIRTPSKLATDSGLLSLETAVASLSAVVANVTLSDPSLAPPVLDLSLGFSQ